jgi:hypothetical protein
MPRAYVLEYPFEIVQTPRTVYVLYETNHLVRRVYLDGRSIPDGFPRSFMGYSSGHWDGTGLVAETVNFNSLT